MVKVAVRDDEVMTLFYRDIVSSDFLTIPSPLPIRPFKDRYGDSPFGIFLIFNFIV